MTPEITTTFSKSSHSDQQGDCLEIAETADGGRAIRDSKSFPGPLLHLSSEPWSAFLGAVKADALSADA